MFAEKSGPVSNAVKLSSGREFRRHVVHIRRRTSLLSHATVMKDLLSFAEQTPAPLQRSVTRPIPFELQKSDDNTPSELLDEQKATEIKISEPAGTLRRSTRIKTTPTRSKDYVR